jgi:hypothetical protein
VLRVMAALAGAGAVSSVGAGVYCARRQPPSSAAARLTLAFSDPAHPAHVGRRYLDAYPNENDTHRLETLIEARFGSLDAVGCRSTAARALADRNLADFRAGNVVRLDGWTMGRTEARVCALTALLESAGQIRV